MKKVLVCDDDKEILEVIDLILSSVGWKVITSDNVNSIIDQVAVVRPNVIIMDNWIPDTGGIIATQTIKNHPIYRSIPVIYSTANDNIAELAREAGADLSIGKPFDLDEFERILEKAFLLSSEKQLAHIQNELSEVSVEIVIELLQFGPKSLKKSKSAGALIPKEANNTDLQ